MGSSADPTNIRRLTYIRDIFDTRLFQWVLQNTHVQLLQGEEDVFCLFGMFPFGVVPLGLMNAPSTFQRFMYSILKGLDFVRVLSILCRNIFQEQGRAHGASQDSNRTNPQGFFVEYKALLIYEKEESNSLGISLIQKKYTLPLITYHISKSSHGQIIPRICIVSGVWLDTIADSSQISQTSPLCYMWGPRQRISHSIGLHTRADFQSTQR